MLRMQRITSRDNPRLVDAARLIASSRERRKRDRCVLEGDHLVSAYVGRYGAPESAIVLDLALERAPIASLIQQLPEERVVIVDETLWSVLPQVPPGVGIVAVA